MSNPEAAFHQAMLDDYQQLAKLGYRATYFLRMVQEHGGVEAARRLIAQDTVTAGFGRLWEMGLLNLSVEACMLRPEYHGLFTAEERQRARNLLAELHYSAPWDSGV